VVKLLLELLCFKKLVTNKRKLHHLPQYLVRRNTNFEMVVTMKQIDTELTLFSINYNYTFVFSIAYLLRSVSKTPNIHSYA